MIKGKGCRCIMIKNPTRSLEVSQLLYNASSHCEKTSGESIVPHCVKLQTPARQKERKNVKE